MPVLAAPKTLPSHIQRAWETWQQREEVTSLLSESLRAYGYTVLYVPPQSRGVFLDMLPLLTAIDAAAQQPRALPPLRGFWRAWHAWLPRLTAYLLRLAAEKPATFPLFPHQDCVCNCEHHTIHA